MTDAMYWSVTNESSMPWRLSSSKMCPRQGLSTMGTIGLGRLIVSGRRRLPSPPAMTTACIERSLVRENASDRTCHLRGAKGCGVGEREHEHRHRRADHCERHEIEGRP